MNRSLLHSVSRVSSPFFSKSFSVVPHSSFRSLMNHHNHVNNNNDKSGLLTIKHSNTFPTPSSSPSSSLSLLSSSLPSSSIFSSLFSSSSSSSVFYRPQQEYEKNAQPSEPVTSHHLPHPIWDNYFIDKIDVTHQPPKDWVDRLAYRMIKAVRFNFDWMSGYSFGKLNESKVLRRCIFLETVAGVPGSVAGTMRHLASLRKMKSDHGWIHTLLEEAENERMHLLTFLELKEQSSALFRTAVMLSQGIFYNFYFIGYLISPRFCHRVVGYLEEEATRTYTHILQEIENGSLQHWKTMPAPKRAMKYWKLAEGATMKDVIKVIRADEAHHRDVNHTFAELDPEADNPFPPGH